MGTSVACTWAIIYFVINENQALLVQFKHNLLISKCFIDDIFGILIPAAVLSTQQHFYAFNDATNNFGILIWEFKELSTSVNFLDFTISTKNNKHASKTYQKAINVCPYSIPYACHPSCMAKDKGIGMALLHIYYKQNTTFLTSKQ
jgi:hypothetical protein